MSNKPRVLIVDDNEDMRNILACLVQSANGEAPSHAVSAAEALAHIEFARREGRQFDLILLDIKMPGVNGNDAAIALKKAGYTGLIAACTAAVSGVGRRQALEAGIGCYFDKLNMRRETILALLDQARPKAVLP